MEIISNTPLISIITPTYNRANLLCETIESILEQTYNNFEYIIVDDGSTDNTSDVVKKYLKDKRVKYYKHENMGESKTTNKGYSLATGELTAVINSDDPLMEKDYLEQVVKAFNDNPDVLAVYPSWVDIDINSEIKAKIDVPQFDLVSLSHGFNITLGPGMVIKYSALKKIGFRDESVKYTGDLNISYKLARIGKILHIDSFGASHRSHDGCEQVKGNQKQIAKEILNLNLMIFKDDRKNIPLDIIKIRNTILNNALILYKNYVSEPYNFFSLRKEYKSLFTSFFDEFLLYLRLSIYSDCIYTHKTKYLKGENVE